MTGLGNRVVFTSGGIDKLVAYQRLSIPEVWFWEDEVLSIYSLLREGDVMRYEKIPQSKVLAGLDVELLSQCILMSNHVESIKAFRHSLSE